MIVPNWHTRGYSERYRSPVSHLVSLVAVLLVLLTAGTGCRRQGHEAALPGTQQPAGPSVTAEATAPPILRVLCEAEFLPETLLADFTALTGIVVVVASPSNHPDLSSAGASFDLALVDSLSVSQLIDEEALNKIDAALIPNLANISPPFSTDPIDPTGAYSVPFLWGTFGIEVNRKVVLERDVDWRTLFDRSLSGRIDMPDDIRMIVEAALRDMGTSLGEADKDTLDRAADRLLEQRKIVRGYFPASEIVEHLADGSSDVAFLDGRSATSAMERNASLEYVVPASGSPLWLLVWVVPARSGNAEGAVRLIDFLLDPKRVAAVSNATRVANTVGGSRPYLDNALVQDPTIILPADVLGRCALEGPIDLETENFLMRLKDDFM